MLQYDSDRTFPPEKKQKKKRPFLLTLLGLLLVFGFYFAVMLLLNGGGGLGGTQGSGTADGGDGPGAGLSGSDRGAGDSGKGITSGKSQGDGHGDAGKEQSTAGTPETAAVPSPQNESASASNPADGKGESTVAETEVMFDNVFSIPKEKITIAAPKKIVSDTKNNSDSNTGASAGSGLAGLAGKKGFFGVKVQGNTIFVVDVSGSMSGGTSEGPRIEILKRQLKNAIETSKGLKDGLVSAKYYILAFGGGFCCGGGSFSLFPANGKMKNFRTGVDKETGKYIDALSPGGGTPLLGAMQEVRKLLDKKENKIRTIFILTDGDPDSGWPPIRDYIRKEIPEKIIINTISIGNSCQDMKELAKERSGTYREFL